MPRQRKGAPPDPFAIVTQFLTHNKEARHHSLSSQRNYRVGLERYAGWCKETSRDILRATSEDLELYLGHLGRQNYQPATLQVRYAQLRSFYRWARRARLIKVNPCLEVDVRFPVSRDPRYLTVADMERLMATPDRSTPTGGRDLVLLALGYLCGLRPAEAVALELRHTDLAHAVLEVVQSKGQKTRIVPMPPRAIEIIVDYLARHRPAFQPLTDRLVVNRYGKRLSSTHASRIVAALADQAGVQHTHKTRHGLVVRDICGHFLRHMFATHMHEAGAEDREIADILGHSSTEVTQAVYIRSSRTLQGLAIALHPAGQLPPPPPAVPPPPPPPPPPTPPPVAYDVEAPDFPDFSLAA